MARATTIVPEWGGGLKGLLDAYLERQDAALDEHRGTRHVSGFIRG